MRKAVVPSCDAAMFFQRNLELVGCGNKSDAVYQIVKEFTDNAVDAISQKKGRDVNGENSISIELVIEEKDRMRITVQDSGLGIPEERIKFLLCRVFGSSKANGGEIGTFGIGLKAALVYATHSGAEGKLIVKTTTKNEPVFRIKHVTWREESGLEIVRSFTVSKEKVHLSGSEVSLRIVGAIK